MLRGEKVMMAIQNLWMKPNLYQRLLRGMLDGHNENIELERPGVRNPRAV